MRTSSAFLSVICLFVIDSRVQGSLITINSSHVQAEAQDFNFYLISNHFDIQFNPSSAFPLNTPLLAAVGGASSQIGIAHHDVGSQTVIDYDIDHIRAGGDYSIARSTQLGSLNNGMSFTALDTTSYKIRGEYTASGEGRVLFDAYLLDATANVMLFRNQQYSISSEDVSFTMNAEEGDSFNLLIGSPIGQLLAGHDYLWYIDAFIDSDDSAGGYFLSGASAEGFVTLTIGDAVTSTPEPTSMALLGLAGVAGMGMRWGRGRRTRVLRVAG